MPLQKPRGRKRESHTKAYAVVAVIVILGLVSLAFAYTNGYFQGSSTTSGSTSSSSASSTACPTPPSPSNGNDYGWVCTSAGNFEFELFASQAPKTVANFVSLAQSHFFDNLIWWRVEPGFVIQTGDPNTRYGGGSRSTWGSGSQGSPITFENATSLHNDVGTLAMASTGYYVGGTSQFFINLANNRAALDGKYAVFGQVVSGLSVVQVIGSAPYELQPGSTVIHEPVTPVTINTITVSTG